jgi:hypothetical protein
LATFMEVLDTSIAVSLSHIAAAFRLLPAKPLRVLTSYLVANAVFCCHPAVGFPFVSAARISCSFASLYSQSLLSSEARPPVSVGF